MIIWSKKNGYSYEDEFTGKRYSIFEANTYKGEASTDAVAIWDDTEEQFVNFLYGADFLYKDLVYFDEAVAHHVKEYEADKLDCEKVRYRFSKAGVRLFTEKASDDFFKAMDEFDDLGPYNINITVGGHKIVVPLGAMEWDGLETWLTECAEEYGE